MADLITIQGEVRNAQDDGPVPGITIVARSEGTEIQQRTDSQGKFALLLPAGAWHILARGSGFSEPEPYFSNFFADTPDLNFKLGEGYSLSGWVVESEKGEPMPGVVVEAQAEIDSKKITRRELTDDNGSFRFVGLQSGKWELRGAQSRRQTHTEKLTLGPETQELHLILARQMTKKEQGWGWGFFAALCILLVALASLYILAHRRIPPVPEPELESFTGQVLLAEDLVAGINANPGASEAAALQSMRVSIASLSKNWNNISSTLLALTQTQNAQVSAFLSEAEAAANADNAAQVGVALAELESVLNESQSPYFWSEPPLKYLEVLLWSLAGILVSLLVTSGYYLRHERFYPEGIWMHASHLISVPLLALVFVFLISQIQLSVQIGDSAVALDVNDPRILIAISFIIAVRPWGMIDFVRDAASRFFGQIQRRIGGESDTQTEPRIA